MSRRWNVFSLIPAASIKHEEKESISGLSGKLSTIFAAKKHSFHQHEIEEFTK